MPGSTGSWRGKVRRKTRSLEPTVVGARSTGHGVRPTNDPIIPEEATHKVARKYFSTIAAHNPLGPISLAAGIHLAASIPNFLCQEQISLGEGYLKRPFAVEDGYIALPTGPGLGIELDEESVAAKIDHDWGRVENYDPADGSVIDR